MPCSRSVLQNLLLEPFETQLTLLLRAREPVVMMVDTRARAKKDAGEVGIHASSQPFRC